MTKYHLSYASFFHEEPVESYAPSVGIQSESIANVLSPQDYIAPLKQTIKGKANTLAAAGDFGGNRDTELVGSIIGGNLDTKYFNKAQDANGGTPGVNTSFIITPAIGLKTITTIQFSTANDMPELDSLHVTLEWSNNPQSPQSFELIYQPAWELIWIETSGDRWLVSRTQRHMTLIAF